MKYIFIVTLIISQLTLWGQKSGSTARQIEVTGTSKIEITPDEIFVGITLKEYMKGARKTTLNQLEEKLVMAIKKLGIPEDNLTVESIHGYNWNWRKQKAEEFLGSKSFILMLNDVKRMNDLIDRLDPEGINNVQIRRYSHSRMELFTKEVKIAAMKAAQQKATYLLESVGASLGKIMQVRENAYNQSSPMMRSSRAYAETASVSDYQSQVEFMKITVKAEMYVTFEIE